MTSDAPASADSGLDTGPVLRDRLFWLVLLVAAALRLLFLDQMELWWDEFVTLGRSSPDLPRLLSGLMYQSPSPVSTDCSPPLHHLLVHLALGFGHAGSIIRLPSVLFGCLSVACVMALAKRLAGRRCAVLAGLFCALSLFHLYYSRDIRWYAVYYGCSLAGLFLLYLAVTENHRRYWLGFALAGALSLYASYVAAPALAGEALFLAGLAAKRHREGNRRAARAILVNGAWAFALMAILYAPWLPAQYYAFHSFYGKGTRNPFDLAQFLANMRFFLEYFYPAKFNHLWLAVPLAVWGFASALAGRARTGAALILCWGVPSMAAAYLVKTEFSVSPKYVMSGFYLLAFGLGFGAEAAARRVQGLAPRVKGLGWATGCACLLLAGSSNLHLAAFYQGKTFSDKEALRRAALLKNNLDIVLYDDERNYSVVGDWYLGGLYNRASGAFGREYKRFLHISPGKTVLPGTRKVIASRPFDASVGGLINRAPLPVLPDASGRSTYADGYRDFRLFTDAFATDNVTVNLSEGGLAPSDMSRPGTALYAFDLDAGPRVATARVRLTAHCLKRNVFLPDAAVTVRAGPAPDRLVVLGVLEAPRDPNDPFAAPASRGARTITGEWSIPPEALAGRLLYLAITVSNGTREGAVKAAAVAVDFTCQGPPPSVAAVLRQEWDRVLANLEARQRPSGDPTVTPGRLVAFSGDAAVFPPDPGTGVNGPEARQTYRAAHPGQDPVYVVRGPDGKAALELYDPWLAAPFVSVGGRDPVNVDLGAVPLGYKAPGSMRNTLALFDGRPLPLSLGLPQRAETVLSQQGESFILAQELFDAEHFTPGDFYALRDARVRRDEAVLTCTGQTPCEATYRFASLYPMDTLTLTTFPRLFNDPGRHNAMRLSVAADAGPFETVYALKSDGSGLWSDTDSHPRLDAVPLPKGTHAVRVRLEADTDGGIWHSSTEQPMTFEMRLDAAAMPPFTAGAGSLANGTPESGPVALLFTHSPAAAFEELRPGLVVTPWMRPFFR